MPKIYKSKKSSPKPFLSRVGVQFPLGLFFSALGILKLIQPNPHWSLGFPLQVLGVSLLIRSLTTLIQYLPFEEEGSGSSKNPAPVGFWPGAGRMLQKAYQRIVPFFPYFSMILAGLCGWFGIKKLTFPIEWIGLPFWLLAAFFLIHAFPARMKVLPYKYKGPDPKKKLPGLKTSGQNLTLWLVLFGLMAVAQYYFRIDHHTPALILTVGTFLWLLWLKFNRGFSDSPASFFKFSETKLLWLIILLESLLTFPHLGDNITGLCLDESNNLMDSWSVAIGTITTPFVTGWGGTPTFPYFFVGAFFKLFGPEPWAARLVSLLANLGATWFFYRWARLFFSETASLFATFCLAISWWNFYYSLSVWNNTLLYLTMCCAFYYLEKGLQQGRRMDYFWAGISAGACVMNYVPGRSVPVMMFCTLIGYILIRGWGFVKTYWKPLFLTLFSFTLFLGPFLMYAYRYPLEVFGRVQLGWIHDEFVRTGSHAFLWRAYYWSLAGIWAPTWGFRLAPTPWFNYLDPFTAVFFILAIFLTFIYWKRPAAWVFLPALYWSLSANALGIQYSPMPEKFFASNRSSIIIPILYFGIAFGLDWFLGLTRSIELKHKRTWLKGFLALLVAGTVAFNVPVMVTNLSNTRESWAGKGYPQIYAAQLFNKSFKKDHILCDLHFVSAILQFLTINKCQFTMFDKPEIPIRNQVDRDVMMFFTYGAMLNNKAAMERYYPHAVWTEFKTPWDEPYLAEAAIQMAEVQAAQKGMKLGPLLP